MIGSALLYAWLLVLMLSTLAVAQGEVYLPILTAGQETPDAVGVSAAANGKHLYRFTGETANAYFSSYDDCAYSYAGVSATDSWYRDAPGKGTKTSSLSVWYDEGNWCTGSFRSGYGWTELPDNSVASTSATVDVTLDVCGYDEYWNWTCLPAEVSLTWKATGASYKSRYHSSFGEPNCRYMYRNSGTSRDAGLSGSLLIGAMDYASAMESSASIDNVKDGSMTIGCATPTPPPPPLPE